MPTLSQISLLLFCFVLSFSASACVRIALKLIHIRRLYYEQQVCVVIYAMSKTANKNELEIAAQGIAQCKVSASRVVVDAALRRIG